jgi:hypothetical protein
VNQTLSDLRAIRELILDKLTRIRPWAVEGVIPEEQRRSTESLLSEWEERLARFDEDLQEAYAVSFTSKLDRELQARKEIGDE